MEWKEMTGSSICSALLCSVGDNHQLDFSLDSVFLSRNIIAIFVAMDFLDSSVIILLFEDIFMEGCLTSRSNYEWFIRLIPHHSSLTYQLNALKVTTRKHRENESKGRNLLALHFLTQSSHPDDPLFITTF
jgi:hypothetical protein